MRTHLELFDLCHAARVDPMSGHVTVERTAFPAAGGAGDQDARTMQAFDVLRQTAMAVAREQRRARETR